MDTYTCSKCGEEKPEHEMSKSNKRQCKACWAKYMREWYAAQSEERKQVWRDRVKRYRETDKANCLLTRIRSFHKRPTKVNARRVVEAAVIAGVLHKPQECEDCGTPHDPAHPHRLHAHHLDYSKSLLVVWVCPKCHGARHKALRAIA